MLESEKRHGSVSGSQRTAFRNGCRDAPVPFLADVMIALGVNCNTHCAFFAVAVDGELRDGHGEYIEAPTLAESWEVSRTWQ
jgi:hypothetical protein